MTGSRISRRFRRRAHRPDFFPGDLAWASSEFIRVRRPSPPPSEAIGRGPSGPPADATRPRLHHPVHRQADRERPDAGGDVPHPPPARTQTPFVAAVAWRGRVVQGEGRAVAGGRTHIGGDGTRPGGR